MQINADEEQERKRISQIEDSLTMAEERKSGGEKEKNMLEILSIISSARTSISSGAMELGAQGAQWRTQYLGQK